MADDTPPEALASGYAAEARSRLAALDGEPVAGPGINAEPDRWQQEQALRLAETHAMLAVYEQARATTAAIERFTETWRRGKDDDDHPHSVARNPPSVR